MAESKDKEMSEWISSFKELRVYKLAFEVQQEIFETSKRFPSEERYALTDQVRRASRSIGAQHYLKLGRRAVMSPISLSKLTRCRRRTGRITALVGYSLRLAITSRREERRSLSSEMLKDWPNAWNYDG